MPDAVRAGLAVNDAVRALNLSQPLAVRLGIASGLVVVGDLIGEGAAQERGVVGETPNLAARLQAIAAPNRAVVADGTRRLLGSLFEVAGAQGMAKTGIRAASRRKMRQNAAGRAGAAVPDRRRAYRRMTCGSGICAAVTMTTTAQTRMAVGCAVSSFRPCSNSII
jgi:class 3 adenylate cyclase